MSGETLEAVEKVPGAYGGHRYAVRPRKGLGWYSSEDRGAPQGSPLWVFEYLEPDVAAFFGFERKGDLVYLPDQVEFMGALKAFNLLPKGRDSPVATWGAYMEPDLHAPLERYLVRIATEGLLPWGTRGNYFHHDLNFHVLTSLIMPTEILALTRRQLTTIFDFKAFLGRNHPDLAEDPVAQQMFEKYFKALAVNMDYGTGTLSFVLPRFREPGIPNLKHGSLYARLRVMAGHGLSPADFFRSFTNATADRIPGSDEFYRRFNAARKEFLDLRARTDPRFDQGLPEARKIDWIKSQVGRRIEQVRKEVRRHAKEGEAP